jgi:hypothetical protein
MGVPQKISAAFVIALISSLLKRVSGGYTSLTFCNANTDNSGFAYSGTGWNLQGNVSAFFDYGIETYVGPGMCQTLSYGKPYTRAFEYNVCNNTVAGSLSDPRCHPSVNSHVGWGSYIGRLNITVSITNKGNTFEANFTQNAQFGKELVMKACETSSSYYQIYINTTDNIPPCPEYTDDRTDDKPSDDSTDNGNSNHGHKLSNRDIALIAILPTLICACAIYGRYAQKNNKGNSHQAGRSPHEFGRKPAASSTSTLLTSYPSASAPPLTVNSF